MIACSMDDGQNVARRVIDVLKFRGGCFIMNVFYRSELVNGYSHFELELASLLNTPLYTIASGRIGLAPTITIASNSLAATTFFPFP